MSARLLSASDAVVRARAAFKAREAVQAAAFDAWELVDDSHDAARRARESEYDDAKRTTLEAAFRLQLCLETYFGIVEREQGRDPERASEDDRRLRPERPSGHVMTNE